MATENLIMEMAKQGADRQVSMSRTFFEWALSPAWNSQLARDIVNRLLVTVQFHSPCFYSSQNVPSQW